MGEKGIKRLTCIECPVGCEMTVEIKNGEIKVSGNKCARGKKYAIHEMTDPKRVLTTTVFVEGGVHSLLPVVSTDEIPKDMIKKCVRTLSKIKVKAPVDYGDVIAENICGTGVDVIASRSMVRK
ncbi:MAG: DUF1667 domain-containing protein [Nitrospiraceae bacterium]|nr:DUF1667 domain-containing protein [Nitrospiraceae bacterium]